MGDPRYTSGWIAMHDPLLTTFTPADLFFNQYLVVGFRFDTRLVPPKLLMLERRRLERERADARGVPWVSAAERKEIKEEIASRLIAQALPSPPDGFAELCQLAASGRLDQADEILEVANRYWGGVEAWAQAQGLAIESTLEQLLRAKKSTT